MKEKLKKLFGVLLVTVATMAFALSVNAATTDSKVTFSDVYLTFDIWQGSGTSSVSIGDDFLTKGRDIVKFEEFEEVQFDGKTLDESNYTVTKSGENIIVMLKEEYIKTLKDDSYLFNVVFAKAIVPARLHVIRSQAIIQDSWFDFKQWTGSGDAQVLLEPKMFSRVFYASLFNELSYKGHKVDSSNYSISQFANVTTITLKESYVKTLPSRDNYFKAAFKNVVVSLRLKIDTLQPKIDKVENPAQVKKVKVTSNKKKLTVKWKKLSNVTGYSIKIGTNKSITKNKKVITIKKNSAKLIIKGLKAKKKYYIKVRAYKTVDGKNYWGTWSKKVVKKTK